MQKARGQAVPGCPGQRPPTACRHTVSGTISLPSQGCFSPFPHGTGSLSVAGTYLALGDGPPGFPQGSTCPAVLRSRARSLVSFAYGALTLYRRTFQTRSARDSVCHSTAPLQWRHARSCNTVDTTLAGLHIDGLGCSPFARRYWGNRVCFLFLRVLRWFTSPGWLRHPMYSDAALEDCPRGVAPFGNLRVKACLRLTEAYRSLPRPSSPSCAKASTVRP